MKLGDLVPVSIGAQVVAQGKVTELNESDSTVTIIVPATKVVANFVRQLDLNPAPTEASTSHAVLGVDENVTVTSSNGDMSIDNAGNDAAGNASVGQVSPEVSEQADASNANASNEQTEAPEQPNVEQKEPVADVSTEDQS